MNIGPLYQVKKHSWLLFPTKELVTDCPSVVRPDYAAWWAARHSRKYNCNVSWFPPESFVVFLEEDGKLKKFLTSEGLIGWTQVNKAWLGCFEEVKSE